MSFQLERIAEDCDPLRSFYTDSLLAALRKVSIANAQELLLWSVDDLVQQTGLSRPLIKAFKADVARHLTPLASNGWDLYQYASITQRTHSSGIKAVDELLHGGFCTQELSELSGPSCGGKTSLCLSTIVHLLLSDPVATIIVLDTTGSFDAAHVVELLQHSAKSVNPCINVNDHLEISRLLNRVRTLELYDIETAFAVIEGLVTESVEEDEDHNFNENLELLVFDSFSVLFTPLLSSTQGQGHALMLSLARKLKRLAIDKNIAVLLTTTAVHAHAAQVSNQHSYFNTTFSRPALGASWTFCKDLLVYIQRKADLEQNQPELQSNRLIRRHVAMGRVAEVMTSRRFQSGGWCLYDA
ncbi:hypothetical protein BZG36_04507 [Bifiguratus adelaidae]|uniref:RecA family profile 1 domain-containing protein n=1 Tax=Bifiguratus adelaidae TaxID=1938954 RepID=A0A261XW16_9FUNG|nr:hypothetical protein BZG36_04507 [Bifiguratus adelaidae]